MSDGSVNASCLRRPVGRVPDLAGPQTLAVDTDQAAEVLTGGPSHDKVSTRPAEFAVLMVTAK